MPILVCMASLVLIVFFKQQIKNSSIGHTLARVHIISCTLNTSIVNIELLLVFSSPRTLSCTDWFPQVHLAVQSD